MFKTLTAWVLAVMAGVSFILTGCGKEEAKVEKAPVKATESTENSIDQSTPQATLRAYLQAMLNNDYETMWAVISPEIKEEVSKKFGSPTAACSEVARGTVGSSERRHRISEILDESDDFEELTNTMLQNGDIVKYKSKYYLGKYPTKTIIN